MLDRTANTTDTALSTIVTMLPAKPIVQTGKAFTHTVARMSAGRRAGIGGQLVFGERLIVPYSITLAALVTRVF